MIDRHFVAMSDSLERALAGAVSKVLEKINAKRSHSEDEDDFMPSASKKRFVC